MIYFIEHDGHIKVGYASNVERRLKEFRTSNLSFVRLGSMEGTRGHEKAIHHALADYRTHGEWFKDCPEVREFLTKSMSEGVEEWKPQWASTHTPTMWDQRAEKLCAIICANKPHKEYPRIEQEFSIPAKTLWTIKYRQWREVSVGEFFALLSAARETIRRRQEEVDRDLAFVSDLEREDAQNTNQIFDVERELDELRGNRR